MKFKRDNNTLVFTPESDQDLRLLLGFVSLDEVMESLSDATSLAQVFTHCLILDRCNETIEGCVIALARAVDSDSTFTDEDD